VFPKYTSLGDKAVLITTGAGFGLGALTYNFGRTYIERKKYSTSDRATTAASI
jgi:hypothetical protein